jgi:hypothetical protein
MKKSSTKSSQTELKIQKIIIYHNQDGSISGMEG